MKTIYHSHLRGSNGCLGFYYGLEALQSDFPEGGLPGEFFINSETQSLWIWDVDTRTWANTNHLSPAPFLGMIADPATFAPSLGSNVEGCFVYVAGQKGYYEFPLLRSSNRVAIETESAGIIALTWDGSAWYSEFTPLSFDNTGSPVALFQGEWSSDKEYQCVNGFADVVRYNSNYYRLKSLVATATSALPPDESDEWEMLPHYSAVADKLDLPADGVVSISEEQKIQVPDGESAWNIGSGEIAHSPSGVKLSKTGDFIIPVEDGDYFVLSPQEQGLALETQDSEGETKQLCKIARDSDGDPLIEMVQTYGKETYTVSIKPKSLELRQDGITNSIGTGHGYRIVLSPSEIIGYQMVGGNEFKSFHIDSMGSNLLIKGYDESPEPGDLYYDEDYVVHYCCD